MTGLYQEAALSQLYNQPAHSMPQKPLAPYPKSVWGRRTRNKVLEFKVGPTRTYGCCLGSQRKALLLWTFVSSEKWQVSVTLSKGWDSLWVYRSCFLQRVIFNVGIFLTYQVLTSILFTPSCDQVEAKKEQDPECQPFLMPSSIWPCPKSSSCPDLTRLSHTLQTHAQPQRCILSDPHKFI